MFKNAYTCPLGYLILTGKVSSSLLDCVGRFCNAMEIGMGACWKKKVSLSLKHGFFCHILNHATANLLQISERNNKLYNIS